MKILKWFRYGFLSLGILSLLLFPLGLGLRFLDLRNSGFLFIVYLLLSIITSFASKNKFKPKILYYCGAMMSTIVFFGSMPYSMVRNLLNRYFSHATVDKAVVIIIWLYFVLAIFLLLTGTIWEAIVIRKNSGGKNQKNNSLSKIFFSFGMTFIIICVLLFLFGLLEPISYTPFTFKSFSTTMSCLTIISLVSSIPMFILGLVYKIIFLIKVRKEKSIINVEE